MLRPRGTPAQSSPENRQPSGEITVRVTAGAKRFAVDAPLDWQAERGSPVDSILIDPGQQFQEILGFGASFTDAACYMFNQLSLRPPRAIVPRILSPLGNGL
jgi:hypothetical protein